MTRPVHRGGKSCYLGVTDVFRDQWRGSCKIELFAKEMYIKVKSGDTFRKEISEGRSL
jgi:hypothetical protein